VGFGIEFQKVVLQGNAGLISQWRAKGARADDVQAALGIVLVITFDGLVDVPVYAKSLPADTISPPITATQVASGACACQAAF